MKTRIITSIVAIAIAAPMLYFSDTIAFLFLILFGAIMATMEIMRCTGILNRLILSIPSFAFVAAIIVIAYLVKGDVRQYFFLSFAIFFLMIIYYLSISTFSKGSVVLTDASATALMLIYVCIGFSSLLLIRHFKENGFILMIYSLITPFLCDIGAYFIGVTMGKHKLIPEISPKKTIEGAVGGLVIGTILSSTFIYVVGGVINGREVKVVPLIVISFIICLLSQVGDLVSSNFKRHYNIKDFGKLLPGHGGVMDRMDSVVYTAPIVCMLFTLSDFFLFIK